VATGVRFALVFSLSAAVVCLAPAARAAERDREVERRTFMARIALGTSIIGGQKLYGTGSRGRWSAVAPAMEIDVQRIFTHRLGVEVGLVLFPPAQDTRDVAYGRLQGALDAVLVDWGGRHAGSLIAGIGGGFDAGRWWFEDARGYGLATLKGRVWLTRDVNVQAMASVAPFGAKYSGWEQRYELGFAWKLLAFGVRFAWLEVRAGDPARWLPQHEVGMFVGVGVF